MKKMYSVIAAVLLVTSIAACGNAAIENGTQSQQAVVAADGQQAIKNNKVLVVYFSRWGNTNYPDNVDASTSASIIAAGDRRVGTTEYLAKIIQEQVGGDIHPIKTTKTYPVAFDELIDLNHQEMAAKYQPELQGKALSLEEYDTVFIGYPVWANTLPQAIISFVAENNLQGKRVIPFCTHDGYSSGRSYADLRKLCAGSEVLDGIAIEAKDVPGSSDAVRQWLRDLELEQVQAQQQIVPLTIKIGTKTITGVLETTPLAQEIQAMLPLTVDMVGYGGREYYGGIAKRPQNSSGGSLYYTNGDITYCPRNNTLAIFYAKASQDRSPLTMEVIRIGRITSDLAVFETFGSSEEITFAVRE